MAVWSEFEEKEFETLANVALVTEQVVRKRSVQVFSPGQVLEKTLGFDFATNVGLHTRLHRRLFGSTPGAPGATPAQLAQLRMPIAPSTRLLNLFLQYKRPEHFKQGHRSALWPRNEEFLRFTVSESNVMGGGYHFDQIQALDALAASLGSEALVRYACPTLWRKVDLYGVFGAGQLLELTTFVAPSKLADATGQDPFHRRWTFQRSRPDAGIPNPNGELTSVEDGEDLISHARAVAADSPRRDEYPQAVLREAALAQHVRGLVDSRKSRLRARDRVTADVEDSAIEKELKRVPASERTIVRASVDLATIARDLGVQWTLLSLR